MPTEKVIATSLYRIDLDQEELEGQIVAGPDTDFTGYTKALIQELQESDRQKAYLFPSADTEVARQIKELKDDISNWDDATEVIAKRLFREEKKVQDEVAHMNVKLRVGSLVQIFAEVDGQEIMIITKVDHSTYLNEDTFKEQNGLPVNQKVRTQKTAIINFDENGEISTLQLSDTNAKISRYWWDDFLEAQEVNPSERNTIKAFNAIDNLLSRKVKKKGFLSDYWTIRNAVISYFRTRNSLTIDTLVQDVLDGYQPDDNKLDITKLKTDVRDLPKNHSFDSQFDITVSAIKARIVKQINLAQNLELKFTGDVPDLKNLIKAGEEESGRKFIKIFSDEGYSQFKG
jgi:hypothetical protein